MVNAKVMAGVLLVMAVLFAQVGSALAAPAAQDATPITGTLQSITIETEEGVTTVLVTVEDEAGETQTLRISLEAAVALGLVTVDQETGEVVIQAVQGQTVTIYPASVIPDEGADFHPIAVILGSFFGVDPAVVDGYHEDGFGFGVIAQAMWMAQGLESDITAGMILEAKENNDYSMFVLPDGSTASNWGQFKKAVLGKDRKNLGVIVSGHAENGGTEDALSQGENGKGNGKGKGYGKDNNPGKGKNKNP